MMVTNSSVQRSTGGSPLPCLRRPRNDKFNGEPERRARSRGAARVQVLAQAAQIADEAAVQVPVAAAQIGDEAAVQVPAQDAQIGDEPAVQVQVAVEPDIICQPEIEDNLWEIPDDILDAHWHEIEVQTQNNLVEASLSTNSEIPVIQVPFEQGKRLKGKQGMVPKISRKRTASKDFNRQKQPVRKFTTSQRFLKSQAQTTFKESMNALMFSPNGTQNQLQPVLPSVTIAVANQQKETTALSFSITAARRRRSRH
nr:uncharacterized protein LOC109185271 [Ipomoea batatas]